MRLARLAGAAMLLPCVARGQQTPAREGYYLIVNTDTAFAERATRTPTTLQGEFVDRLRGSRVQYDATLGARGVITRLDTRVFASAVDTVGRPARFTLKGDTVLVEAGHGVVHVPAINGAMLVLNPSAVFIEQMAIRARDLADGQPKSTMLLFLTSGGGVIPLGATFAAPDSVTLSYAGVTMQLRLSPDGRLIDGAVPAQHVRIVRDDSARLASAHRYDAPADAPYTAEEVVVQTPQGLHLSGTLTLPKARPRGRAPAVVTITGSGAEDRDEESTAIPGYRPFRELADTLGRRGIAVLRLDDRGVNGSEAGPAGATSADFANDIRAGVAYLRSRPEIDAARIGLVGHSDGGMIAPMVAETDTALKAIVLMAGTASTGREISMDQLAYAPVLILQGLTDRQVPPSEATKLAAAFRAGGNTHVTVRTFPETNHLFVADSLGAPMDVTGKPRYPSLPSLHVRKEVLGAIADWLSAQFR
ncbi:MAG TPA: alpha/beta fold hydrolase [Gemmatimonadaceae bacterium]|nr:alpha/beta fold hydrolase [Gemmatimonadaceae bacterium]